MERIEINVTTGEQSIVQLTQEEIDAIVANQPIPEIVIPKEVTKFQAKVALYQAGMLEAVEAEISKPETQMEMKLAWQDAQTFKRTSSFVNGMASLLGLTDQQVDDLFVLAAAVE